MIVNGKVLMQGRHVEGEEQILEEARKVTSDLLIEAKNNRPLNMITFKEYQE